jgi:hypothetical protein
MTPQSPVNPTDDWRPGCQDGNRSRLAGSAAGRPAPRLALPASTPLAEVATASDTCQRWRDGQHSWRHRSEGGFDPRRYEVHPVSETAGRSFTIRHHYAHSWPATSQRYGLYHVSDGVLELEGVAVFGVPVQEKVLTQPLPDLEAYSQSLELSRFVLLDQAPGNAESWFLARCFDELLATGVRGIVSFADPVPRTTGTGQIVFKGHIGTIYQASNAAYCGRGTARSLVLLPDGSVLNARSLQKIRSQERGHEYVEERLIAQGAAVPRAGQDPSAWLAEALAAAGARLLRHRGNHRYVFRLGRNRRERERITLGLPAGLPYPKLADAA